MDADTEPRPDPELATDSARVAARLGSAYVLRTLALLAQLHGGDLLTAIIVLRINAANVAHFDAAGGQSAFPGNATPPPDSARRPISVTRLARSLGLPFETTRRYVNRLLESGICVRVKGGVLVPSQAVDGPGMIELRNINLANLRRLTHDLRKAGVVD